MSKTQPKPAETEAARAPQQDARRPINLAHGGRRHSFVFTDWAMI